MALQLARRGATGAMQRRGEPLARAPARLLLLRPSRALRQAIAATTAKATAPVKIILQGRRLEVTPAIRTHVEEKIGRAVGKFAASIKHVDVTISARGGDTGTHGARQQKVDVTLHTLKDGVVRVEDTEASLYASIDLVCDKVVRKLRRMKERAIAKGTWGGRAGPRGAPSTGEEDFQAWMAEVITEVRAFDEDQAREAELAELARRVAPGAALPANLLRSKVLRVDRMPLDDAIDGMEAVGHAFFLFRDVATGAVQVVYKRGAGGYGLLVPEPEA